MRATPTGTSTSSTDGWWTRWRRARREFGGAPAAARRAPAGARRRAERAGAGLVPDRPRGRRYRAHFLVRRVDRLGDNPFHLRQNVAAHAPLRPPGATRPSMPRAREAAGGHGG